MRVHFVASDLRVPANDGLTGQTLELLKGLQDRGVQVKLTAFVKDMSSVDREQLTDLLPEIDLLQLIPTRLPTALRGYLNALRVDRLTPFGRIAALRRNLHRERGDVIHLEGLAAVGMAASRLRERAVIDLIDPPSIRQRRLAEQSHGMRRAVKILLAFLNSGFELWLAKGRPVWHVVSNDDAAALRTIRPHAEIWDIPVLIPSGHRLADQRNADHSDAQEAKTVMLVADLRQEHLRAGVGDLLVELYRTLGTSGSVRLKVLGRISQEALNSILPVLLPIESLEWVENFDETMLTADVVAIPDLVGTGLKNRTMQALSLGRPVVSYAAGIEGIPVTHGREVLIARNSNDFVVNVHRLLEDASLRLKLSANGRKLMEIWGNTENSLDAWCTLYSHLESRSKQARRD